MTKQKNIFSSEQHQAIGEILDKLPFDRREVIRLRYWENLTILEISALMGLKWDAVDRMIEDTQRLLRELCVKHQAFQESTSESQAALAA